MCEDWVTTSELEKYEINPTTARRWAKKRLESRGLAKMARLRSKHKVWIFSPEGIKIMQEGIGKNLGRPKMEMSEEQRDLIEALWKEKTSITYVGGRLGVNWAVAKRWLVEEGLIE